MKWIKYLLLAFVFLVYTTSRSENYKISAQVKRIVRALQKGNTFETAFLPEETKSTQIKNYKQLKALATDNELAQLTRHKNAVVRVYAFLALSNRSYAGLYQIILEHIKDTAVINCYSHGYDLVHSESYKRAVAEFFVSSEAITLTERKSLDSLLIFSNLHLNYTEQLLLEIEPNEIYYSQIRHLALKDDDRYAIIALSKFRRREDLSFIESRIKEEPGLLIESVEWFPDPYFKNVLNEFGKQESKPCGLYAAVAVYKDSFAYQYLYKAIHEPSKNDFYKELRANEIYSAIIKYNCQLYTELFFQLWQTDFVINDTVFSYLKNIDPKRSIQMTTQCLKSPNRINNSTLVIEDLLDFLVEYDSTSAKAVIQYNIDSANVHTLKYFVDKARHFKDTVMIHSMFMRLNQTDNGHIYVPIVSTILSYIDPDLNNRLIDSIKANKGIKGWGLEEVTVLLNQYGLKL